MRLFYTIALAVVISPAAFSSTCLAETKMITAEASYTMGDGESPSFAEAQVLQKAKQAALEEAGTYVEAYTKTQNYDLTTEEIQTLAGGMLKVEVIEKTRTLVGDGLRFYTKIKATVTTDKMEELAQRIKGKNVAEEYKKLQAEYARLSRELENWKQRAAKTPQGPEREAALGQIREREKDFSRVQKEEAALFQRLVSGKELIVSAMDEKAQVDQLLEFIKERGHIIEIDKIRAFPVTESKDSLNVTVPIRLKHSSLLPTVLSDAARRLGGDEVRSALSRWERLRYFTPDSLQPNLTVRTAVGPNYWEDRWNDNLYRESPRTYGSNGRYYYIATPVSVVKLSRSRPIEEHFRIGVGNLVLVLELRYTDGAFVSERCFVPRLVNRLIPAKGVKESHDGTTSVDYFAGPGAFDSRSPLKGDSDDLSILLLLGDTTFNVEFRLSPEKTKRLDRVMTWFDDKPNAPSNVCNVVIKND